MEKRKIKTPRAIHKEARELLALVKDDEMWAETTDEKIELARALRMDIQRLPSVSFSYHELYTILRFLVTLNHDEMAIANYVQDDDEEFLCDVLSAGIIYELNEYISAFLINEMDGIEITIREVGTDAVQR